MVLIPTLPVPSIRSLSVKAPPTVLVRKVKAEVSVPEVVLVKRLFNWVALTKVVEAFSALKRRLEPMPDWPPELSEVVLSIVSKVKAVLVELSSLNR